VSFELIFFTKLKNERKSEEKIKNLLSFYFFLLSFISIFE